MKSIKMALLLVAAVCAFQFSQAQGLQLVNNSGCNVTFGFTWISGFPSCTGTTTNASQMVPAYSTFFVNSPNPGDKVITYSLTYPGQATVSVPSWYCNGGSGGGSRTVTGCGGSPLGIMSWNDNAPHINSPQELQAF